jgi:hypothetical protein
VAVVGTGAGIGLEVGRRDGGNRTVVVAVMGTGAEREMEIDGRKDDTIEAEAMSGAERSYIYIFVI